MPTFPKDFKGMILSAIKDRNPVVILEHRWLHNIKRCSQKILLKQY